MYVFLSSDGSASRHAGHMPGYVGGVVAKLRSRDWVAGVCHQQQQQSNKVWTRGSAELICFEPVLIFITRPDNGPAGGRRGMRHDGAADTCGHCSLHTIPYHTTPYHTISPCQGMRHDGGDMTHVATAASTIHQPRGRGWAEAAWGLPNTSGIYLHSTMQILHFVFDPDSYWA